MPACVPLDYVMSTKNHRESVDLAAAAIVKVPEGWSAADLSVCEMRPIGSVQATTQHPSLMTHIPSKFLPKRYTSKQSGSTTLKCAWSTVRTTDTSTSVACRSSLSRSMRRGSRVV